jgi:hypothetical protein
MIAAKVKLNRLSAFTASTPPRTRSCGSCSTPPGSPTCSSGGIAQPGEPRRFKKKTTVGGIHEALARLDRYKVKTQDRRKLRGRRHRRSVEGNGADPRLLAPVLCAPAACRDPAADGISVPAEAAQSAPALSDEQFIHYDWDFYAATIWCFIRRRCRERIPEELRKTFLFLHGVPDEARRDMGYRMSQALIRYTHAARTANLERYVAYLKSADRANTTAAARSGATRW